MVDHDESSADSIGHGPSAPLSILLVGYLYGSGGIQNHTHWLAQGLVRRGHEVHVATPAPIHDDTPELPDQPQYEVHDRHTITALCTLTPRKKPRFDVAVVAGTGWRSMLGLRLNRRIRKRVFFEVMSGARGNWLDPRAVVRLGFDGVVGQAKPVTKRFCDSFHWTGVSQSIPALPEPLEQTAQISVRDAQHRDGRTMMKAAYFGRLAAHKGVGWMIDRWGTLSQWLESLDIHGGGPEEPSLRAKIESMGLGDKIRLHGRYPTGQPYVDLLQAYDVTLLPTVGEEGAPLVLLESMACGVPFVANGVGGIGDYANRDCRITSGDIAEFEDCVRELHQQWVAGEVCGQRLQSHYEQYYSYAALTDRWAGWLTELAEQGSSSQAGSE